MAEKMNNMAGSYFLVFLSVFNFAALVCVTIYHIQYENNYADISSNNVIDEIKQEFKEWLHPKSKRSNGGPQTDIKAFVYDILHTEKDNILEECRKISKQEVLEILKEAVEYMRPKVEDKRQKRQTNTTAGNELANIFGQIAQTEVDILTQYCGNNSHICLPGQKGEPGMYGIPGAKGDHGVMGPQGLKGEPGLFGIPGSKGDHGVMGPQGLKGDTGAKGENGTKGEPGARGPDGTKGSSGQKGEPGLFGIPGAKGDHGVMGPQGSKGEPGVAGKDGAKGEMGAVGPDGRVGTAGPKGDKGEKGQMGLYGVPGAKGNRGVMGPQGIKGETGLPGLKGVQGGVGLNGSPGLPGQKGAKGDNADALAAPCCTSLGIPEFTEQVQEIKVTEGSNVTLNCNPAGYPPPTLTWNPNPSGLDHTRTTVSPKSITMTNVHVTDSKMFTCLAKNALGDSEKNFNLKVYQHLKFDKMPQNHTIMIGTPVTLECQVEGPLNPQISWYKIMPDGSRFQVTNGVTSIVNGSRLHFDRMDSSKIGQYICEGNNGVEKVQMTAALSTFGPPHITSPSTVTAIKGQTVRLTCDADARPPATISWTYPPGVTNAYKDTDGSLVIVNAQTTDARYFICKATNQYGTDQAQITLNVKVPAEVTVIPDKIAVVPGATNIALECKAAGDPPLTVEWFKDGNKLTGNGHIFILPGNVLLVNQATAADLGEYTCKASNSLGTDSATSVAYTSAGDVRCFDAFTVCSSEICGVNCPANCASSPATVSGGPVLYSKVSSVCKSGISSGVITNAGGTVVWRNSNMAELLGVNKTTTNLPP
ncbi:titin-like [Mercenaria mercenaria]|uniref:titin-like n=1 Tax=Mercenaria mercenaria TaxID=6596 RepID=UPI00234F89D9|nr:titin-like [Mercenaria mercenaria]